jgi:hypothetical protein
MCRAAVVGLLVACAPAPAFGQPPPPEGMEQRRPLTDEDYARKKERGYFTGLPLANSDPNFGVGFGARVYYYYNGTRDDRRFAYTPYLHRVFLQGYASTGGLQFHWLDYDAPLVGESPFRLRAAAIFARNSAANYFGIGTRGMRDLAYPGAEKSFRHASDYEARLSEARPDGTSYVLYDKFLLERPLVLLSLERMLLGGLLRPLVGLGFSYNHIGDYTGRRVDAIGPGGAEVETRMAPTRLHDDCAAGLVVGCEGGWDNMFRFGLSFDTRDFEPDPNSGVYAEISTELGTHTLGSDYDYARALVAVRGYVSPLSRWVDLVLAGRALYQVQSQGTPFFSMDVLPFTEDFRLGLGGVRTLRGYKQDRFIGHVMVLANFELRWTAFHVKILEQDFGFILVPFLDLGRTFDSVLDTTLAGWKNGQGAGLRIAWNQATIAFVDVGFSREDAGVYINFNHIF